ncbi:MAG: hypothetical protein IT323_05420 [Anaerolineae bacterium]|nr:hypothetical protein [Anaerolineae bacterium]
MSAAIAALLAALAVIYKLSITVTVSTPQTTILSVVLDLLDPGSRVLTADEAMSALVYSIVIYLLVFSMAYFVLRMLAVFLAGFGIPDEQQVRLTRDLRRNRGVHVDAMRRQAKLNALYTVRAQQAAVAAQRRRQAQQGTQGTQRKTGQLPPLEPDLSDFNLGRPKA